MDNPLYPLQLQISQLYPTAPTLNVSNATTITQSFIPSLTLNITLTTIASLPMFTHTLTISVLHLQIQVHYVKSKS